MSTLQEFRASKIYIDLAYLADLVDAYGLSVTVPRTDDGEVSLSYALALICGMTSYPDADDFYYLLDSIPAPFRKQFMFCWDAIELEVEEDIVEWSERVGKDATVARIRRLAKEIELS